MAKLHMSRGEGSGLEQAVSDEVTPKVLLNWATQLADFAELEPDGVEGFQRNHSEFFSPEWWKITARQGIHSPRERIWQLSEWQSTQWQFNQHWLREAWREGFKDFFDNMRVLLSMFYPEPPPPQGLGPNRLPAFADLGDLTEERYHHAVLFLISEPWRAAFCVICGKRFVKGHSKPVCCSDACRWKRRKDQQRIDASNRRKKASEKQTKGGK